MKGISFALFVFTLSLFFGCAIPKVPDFKKLNIGMTEQQVIELYGKPDGVKTSKNEKVITYGTYEEAIDGRIGGGFYDVKLIDGKVSAYGRRPKTSKDPDLGIIFGL